MCVRERKREREGQGEEKRKREGKLAQGPEGFVSQCFQTAKNTL